jgi:hypothetical protein
MRAPPDGWKGQIARALASYRAEMSEANALVKTDVRAGVEKMMLAVGHLNDAMGIEKGAALALRQMLADLPLGKHHEWARPDNVGGTRRLDGPERDRRAKAVAMVEVLMLEDGLRACLKPSRLEHALEAHADHEH